MKILIPSAIFILSEDIRTRKTPHPHPDTMQRNLTLILYFDFYFSKMNRSDVSPCSSVSHEGLFDFLCFDRKRNSNKRVSDAAETRIQKSMRFYRTKTGDVHFEFYSRKSDQKIVQDLLNHMIANGSLPGPGPIPLVKTSLSFQQEPALWLSVRMR